MKASTVVVIFLPLMFVHSIKLGVVVENDISLLDIPISEITGSGSWRPDVSVDQFTNDTLDVVWRRLNITNGIYASYAVCDLVNMGVRGIITALPCRSRQYVSSQADTFNLPHLAITTEPCETEQKNNFTLYMTPDYRLTASVIIDVLSTAKWASAVLIFDDTMDVLLKSEVLRRGATVGVETTLIAIKVSPSNGRIKQSIPDVVSRVIYTGSKNVILWTNVDSMKLILTEAKRRGIVTSEHSWIIYSDEISLTEAADAIRPISSANILFIRRDRKTNRCRIGQDDNYCITMSTNISLLHGTIADSIAYFHQSSWTKLDEGVSNITVKCFSKDYAKLKWGSELLSSLKKVSLIGFNKMEGFDSKGYPKKTEFKLYGIMYNTNGSLMNLGRWQNGRGLELNDGQLFANKFVNFEDQMIYVTTKEERPFVVRTKVKNETVYAGFSFDILDEMASRLKFRYTVVEAGDPRYGVPIGDDGNSWNGMIGAVTREEVQMAIGAFAITSLRENVVDFTTPYWEDSIAILTLKSESDTGKLFQMMRPFTSNVWISIAAAVLLTGLVSFFASYLSPYTEWQREGSSISKTESSLKENMWIIYSSVIEQGPTFHPSGISSRCILGFWWLFTILIVSTYTAKLAAFLTVSETSSTINNLEELLAKEDMSILIQDGGNVWTMFQKSDNDVYKEVWNRIQQSPTVDSIDAALTHVKTGKYAYIGMKSILDHVAGEGCGIYAVSKETFNSGTYGMVVPENTPFLEMASYNIMKMLEGGLVDNWKQRWWPKVYNCSGSQNMRTGSATKLRLDSLGGLFIVYSAVTIFAIVCLVAEILGRRCCLLRLKR